MQILVLGGTRFVGRHIVESALRRGHDVTVFHRGSSGPELFPEAEHILGDRATDLGRLAGRQWDATVDVCGYFPRQVNELATALDGRGGQHVFISSVSVYAPPPGPGITEDAELIELADPTTEVVTDQTYGGLKVLCERAAADAYGADLLVVRPTYVVGPHDHTWRFPTWVRRIAAGGEVLCPGPADTPQQVIDARDQGDFVVHLLEGGGGARGSAGGTFHTVSPRPPFSIGDLLSATADVVAPAGTTLRWVDGDRLVAEGLDSTAFPFWEPEFLDEADLNAVDPSAAYAAGLTPRPLADTIADTAAWVREAADTAPPGMGLDPVREADLISRLG
jgi:2'-hydroxyisoflavone reductase